LDEAHWDVRQRKDPSVPVDSNFHIIEEYGLPSAPGIEGVPADWESGYAKERKLKDTDVKNRNAIFEDHNVTVHPNPRTNGVGAVQRSTRFYLLYLFWRGILFLMGGWISFFFGLFLDRMGITVRPRWLRKLVGKSQRRAAIESQRMKMGNRSKQQATLDFWYMTNEGKLVTPDRDELDIEHEIRRRIMRERPAEETTDVEKEIDDKLYQWWKMHGWWGTRDDSGEFQPPVEEDFDDTTSLVSTSTSADTCDEQEWDSESDGRRTPTQANFFPPTQSGRDPAPLDSPLDTTTLARLLHPRDPTSREEARMLAYHLSASDPANPDTQSKILTRSQYRRQVQSERNSILVAGRFPSSSTSTASPSSSRRPLDPFEESEILESLILSRRQSQTFEQRQHRHQQHQQDENHHQPQGGGPTNPSEPLCVICQSSTRTIIAWPCRCLCVCEDCRVSLALNNFGNCVTCRRSVNGFVRLWVP
jgi:Zinc finger, C3HC4 type (RING finger)